MTMPETCSLSKRTVKTLYTLYVLLAMASKATTVKCLNCVRQPNGPRNLRGTHPRQADTQYITIPRLSKCSIIFSQWMKCFTPAGSIRLLVKHANSKYKYEAHAHGRHNSTLANIQLERRKPETTRKLFQYYSSIQLVTFGIEDTTRLSFYWHLANFIWKFIVRLGSRSPAQSVNHRCVYGMVCVLSFI